MKKCFKCLAVKPLKDFYKHPMMADGRVNKCKECNKKDVRENRALRLSYYQEYDKARAMEPHRLLARKQYMETEAGKRSRRRVLARQRIRYPEKYRARYATTNAVRDGRLKKKPCEKCGATRVEAHHEDYSKPLQVRWLCKQHHNEEHK